MIQVKPSDKLNFVIVDPSLRSSGVLTCRNGKIDTYAIQRKEPDRLDVLGMMVKHFANLAAERDRTWDFLGIEDYAFSPRGAQAANTQAEIGGVVRACFAARGVPIIEIPIQTWKTVTGIRLPKGTAKEKRAYQNAVVEKYGIECDTVDEIDCYLMLITLSNISRGIYSSKQQGAVNIRSAIEKLRIEI
jgi:hypothetical protein